MQRTWTSLALHLATRAAVRPRLAVDLVRTAWAFRRRGWQRRPPFLPVPAKDYVGFRTLAQYGEIGRSPTPADVVDYLAWCREWDQTLRR